jgi:tetratricopeptide (TPR) repeat protein
MSSPALVSVFERALDVDSRSVKLWLSYTEMELKSRNVQHARNLFDRAATLLPRVDQLWYKYVYLEELLQNVPGARQVFERWMQWEPDDKAWQAYIKMEVRYQEHDRASAIYERWVAVRPEPRVWVKWGKFEEERGNLIKAREVFQQSLEFFGDEEEQIEKAQAVFSAFAKMETRLKEYERARVIYKVSRIAPCLVAIHQIPFSSRYQGYPARNPPVSMRPTQNSRNSMGPGRHWNLPFSESDVSSTKKRSRMTDETTTFGLTTLDSKRVPWQI